MILDNIKAVNFPADSHNQWLFSIRLKITNDPYPLAWDCGIVWKQLCWAFLA